jgi:hypothetical protein
MAGTVARTFFMIWAVRIPGRTNEHPQWLFRVLKSMCDQWFDTFTFLQIFRYVHFLKLLAS